MTRTVYGYAPALGHTFPDHPENDMRGVAVQGFLQKFGLLDDLVIVEPDMIGLEEIYRVHHPQMVSRLEGVALRGGGRIDGDTYMQEESFDLARYAAGTVCQAASLIATGEADNGFVFVRPPGHHAESNRPMGFCLINNVAVAARHLQVKHGMSKILIIDIDVHHGNGTQEIFYSDPSVFFVSIHQYGSYFYPGTGGLEEVGRGAGYGLNLNVPLPPGVGDNGYVRLIKEVVEPKIREFEPDFMLVSAGYDAHWTDPLAYINLSVSGFAEISQRLITLADSVCDGRILFVQEGGYRLEALSQGVASSIFALQRRDQRVDTLGISTEGEPDLDPLLSQIKARHLIQ